MGRTDQRHLQAELIKRANQAVRAPGPRSKHQQILEGRRAALFLCFFRQSTPSEVKSLMLLLARLPSAARVDDFPRLAAFVRSFEVTMRREECEVYSLGFVTVCSMTWASAHQ